MRVGLRFEYFLFIGGRVKTMCWYSILASMIVVLNSVDYDMNPVVYVCPLNWHCYCMSGVRRRLLAMLRLSDTVFAPVCVANGYRV